MEKAKPRTFSHEPNENNRVYAKKGDCSNSEEYKINNNHGFFKLRMCSQNEEKHINSTKHEVNQSVHHRRELKKPRVVEILSNSENFEPSRKLRNVISPQPFWRKIINVTTKPKIILAFHDKLKLTLNTISEIDVSIFCIFWSWIKVVVINLVVYYQ